MHHYTHRLTPVDHTYNRKALIIGGGIGGLATAIALTQIGFTVEVFERVTLLREVGAGLSLWANAIKALDYLGLASAVRALALPEAAGGIRTPSGDLLMQTANTQLAAWRGVTPFEINRLQIGETWGQGARFGQIPMQGNRVYWFATQNAPAGQHRPDGEKAELLRLFGNWHNPIRALIEATPDAAILRNDLYDRPPLKRWGRGRITLLGDAAHPMTPNLGQGACQALEDAVVLAKQVQSTADIPTALRAYEAARIPRTTMIVNQSRQVGQVGQWANPVAVAGRNWLVKYLLARVQDRQFAPLIGYEL